MKNYLKQNILLVFIILLSLILSVFCIIVRGENIILIFSILALIYLLSIGSWMIYSSFKYKNYLLNNNSFINKPKGYFIQGTLLIISGILIILFPNFLVRFLIGLVLIILPLVSLIQQDKKINYLKVNFWKFIIGLIFVLAFDLILDILFIIVGVALIIFSIFIIYLLIINYKDKKNPNIIAKYIIKYILKINEEESIYE